MTYDNIDEIINRFLVEFYLQTRGDSSLTVSWYDIGEEVGLDRTASSETAEKLIGTGLAEIRTLNGGIGITTDGVAEAKQLGATLERESNTGLALGDSLVLDETGRQAVEQIAAGLKSQIGQKNWDDNSLAELMADLKSIDAQLSSPNPKTAIIRECFRSIIGILQKADDAVSMAPIKTLLGE